MGNLAEAEVDLEGPNSREKRKSKYSGLLIKLLLVPPLDDLA
jgi:hypothetical protein